jgi:elongation factor G
LHEAIREDKLFPVLFTSGLGNIGVDELMDFIVDYTPAASEHHVVTGQPAGGNGEPAIRKMTDTETASVYVFKTISDAFAGRSSYFKVFSGVLKNDATLQNFSRNTSEKFAHISVMQGKQAIPIPELHAGDIGAVAKLRETLTGDTLGDKAAPIQYPHVQLPEPAITFAIEPKSRADEDKLGAGLHKLMEEDAMLRFFRDPQTKEFLIAGTGQQHIEVVVSKMKRRYHAEVVLKAPKVPYRETIRGKADVQGRHKKQTGGRPVQRLQNQDVAAAARRLVRVRQRYFRRRDSEELHTGSRKRNQRRRVARLPGRLSGSEFSRDSLRRFLSRRGFERSLFPDGGPHCFQESHGSRQADAAGADHVG